MHTHIQIKCMQDLPLQVSESPTNDIRNLTSEPTQPNLGVVLDDKLCYNTNITFVARSCRIAL